MVFLRDGQSCSYRKRTFESVMTDRFWAQVPTRNDPAAALLRELSQNLPHLSKPEAETLTLLVGGESTGGIARLRRVGKRSVQLALAAIRRKARVWSFS